jgi:hypothetical protein
MEVYKAISAVMADMATYGIGKTRKNQQQGYNFRGVDDLYNELARPLATHGLVIIPRVMLATQTDRISAKGGTLIYTRITCDFDFVATKDGSKHTATTIGEAMDSADKSSNKAMAAAFKYACMMTFCIPTEGDNDADAVTHEAAPKPAQSMSPAAKVMIAMIDTLQTREAVKEWIYANKEAADDLSDGPAVIHHARQRFSDLPRDDEPFA